MTNTGETAWAVGFVLLGGLGLFHGAAAANEKEFRSNRLLLGLGAGIVRFDSNAKFTDKETGRRIFIDLEGTLNLPETDSFPMFYGYYRFAPKHGIGWQYFRINRTGTLFDARGELGDLTIDGRATLTDRSAFSYVSYNLTLFEDDRAFILASFGIYGLDLKFVFNAEGTLSFDGVPIAATTLTEEESVFAPLPMFGLDAWFTLTRKWAFGTKISLVGGSFQDVSAVVLDTRIRGRYKFNRRVAGNVGISYFDADVTIDKSDLKTEVAYGFDGFFLGLDLGF